MLAWTSSKLNLADAETKSNSSVSDSFRLTLADGRLAVDLKTGSDSVSAGCSLDWKKKNKKYSKKAERVRKLNADSAVLQYLLVLLSIS